MKNKIMDKLFNKNITECIGYDLQWFGLNYLKEVYRQMTVVNTAHEDIRIKLDRIENLFLSNDVRCPRYVCSMSFVNNLDLELFTIQMSEYTAVELLDAIYQYENFGMPDISIPLPNGVIIALTRVDEHTRVDIFEVNRYLNTTDIRLSFYVLSDNFVDDILYSMYFSWLIDLDNGDGEYMFDFINDNYL